jgi:nucleotide-binding universal stress UspA family protein
MYKKILAPLDGSNLAECTLEHIEAAALGLKVKEVILLMVVEPVSFTYPDASVINADIAQDIEKKAIDFAEKYLAKVADDLKKKGVAAQKVIVKGKAADEILDYAEKNNVDLIVISTHGRSGGVRWILGSVTDKIIRHSTVPVLVAAPVHK